MVKPHCSNFRITTAFYSGVRIFSILTAIHFLDLCKEEMSCRMTKPSAQSDQSLCCPHEESLGP